MRCENCGLEKAGEKSREWPPHNWCDPCWTEQRRAAWKIYNAHRREGLLVPPEKCERCGNPCDVGHHTDYTKPLQVVWMCDRCHAKAHRDRKKELR